jgi:hypothetical protein
MAFATCAPPAGAEAGRTTGVDPLATGRVDDRIGAGIRYGRMLGRPPLDLDNALGNSSARDDVPATVARRNLTPR